MDWERRYPIGAEMTQEGVHFRVWAPDHDQVSLILERSDAPQECLRMQAEEGGYYSLFVSNAQAGTLYRYRLGAAQELYADPASRFQPQGPHGPSMVIPMENFAWTDSTWEGIKIEGQIIYELHVGTFTEKGTLEEATVHLPQLAHLGVTAIELMPVNEFAGAFGWGYDGVNLYAPTHHYGTPRDLKQFIDVAHSLHLAVILDVVYNHLGPEGNQLINFARHYLSSTQETDWGQAINFDHPSCREYFLTNVRYWIEEYHLDGLRVDATTCFYCSSSPHILADITREARQAAGKRSIVMIGENEQQDTKLLRSHERGGYGFDALWNDDFHHTAHVRLVGKREAYYTDYLGSPQEFISSFKYGYLYQGQYYDWQKKKRGTPSLDFSPSSMVVFLENHDQVANSVHGQRLWELVDSGNMRALTCLLLLSPNTPMLFQGQEYGSTQPFYYFSMHSERLNKLVTTGRNKELSQFPRLATRETQKALTIPSDPLTFTRCKLDRRQCDDHKQIYNLHRDLIQLRKHDHIFSQLQQLQFDGAVLSGDSFLIRYFGEEGDDRLIIVNFGADHYFNPAPEPLLVAGSEREWEIALSTESIIYGGEGTPPINVPYWKILGHSAIVLKAKKMT